ncbi:MAG: endonuclease/exonuclease/phosphatase family protein [Candidatus Paceibacterota bacterium]
MKLITLNTWGTRIVEPLTAFLKKHSEVDIFLLQEIYENDSPNKPLEHPLTPVTKILTNYKGYYRRAEKGGFGLAIFIKKTIEVMEEGEVFVHGVKDATLGEQWWRDLGKNLQYLKFDCDGSQYTTFNFHGLWEPTGKNDSPNRLKQSEEIISFMKKHSGKIVLGGDFNLRPETASIKMLEHELGLKNLITEYGVTSTRTPLYTRSAETYADYLFLSPQIKIKDFKVLPDVVSDHAALYVECE